MSGTEIIGEQERFPNHREKWNMLKPIILLASVWQHCEQLMGFFSGIEVCLFETLL